MAYFYIQHHGDDVNCIPSIDWLQHKNCSLGVWIDTPNAPSSALGEQIEKSIYSHVTLAKSLPISWGGISIVRQTISAMEEALKVDNWRFFITLSGSCTPVKPVDSIRDILYRNYQEKGISAYMNIHHVTWKGPNIPPVSLAGHSDQTMAGRAQITGDAALINLLNSRKINPVQCVNHRRLFQFKEIGKNQFFMQQLDEAGTMSRQQLTSKFGHFTGRQWVILHRSVVEWMFSSGVIDRATALLEDVFIPDETFFQSILSGQESPFAAHVHPDNLWFRRGGPKSLSSDELRDAIKGEYLFARKYKESQRRVIESAIAAQL